MTCSSRRPASSADQGSMRPPSGWDQLGSAREPITPLLGDGDPEAYGQTMPETEQPGRDPLEQHFASAVRALAGFGAGPGALGSLSPERGLELFDAQLASRMLDVAARMLRAGGAGYYTIGSSGHEGNAGVAGGLGPRRRAGTAPPTCCPPWSARPTSRSRAAGTRCSGTGT